MIKQCQGAVTKGANKGQRCPHQAKYPEQYPRFCGNHRTMVEATQLVDTNTNTPVIVDDDEYEPRCIIL